jgi:hypothetical protein
LQQKTALQKKLRCKKNCIAKKLLRKKNCSAKKNCIAKKMQRKKKRVVPILVPDPTLNSL